MMSREGAGNLPGDKQEPENTGTPAPPPRLFKPGALKQLFHALKKALTRKDEPAPEVKRKRREETGRSFRMAARKMMRRALQLPAEVYYRATLYLADTLDWLNQWHHYDEQLNDDVHASPPDYLYPHL